MKLREKEYGLHFGLGAFEIASEIFDVNADLLFSDSMLYKMVDEKPDYKNPVMVRKEVVFGALVNWCEDQNEKLEITYSQFRNEYNDFTEEQHKEIVNQFKKSKYVGKIVEELLEEVLAKMTEPSEPTQKKKKATLKVSSKTALDGE